MKHEFIFSGDPTVGNTSKYIQKGRYVALYLVIYGTTDAGQTLTKEDVGRIRLTRHGREKQSETFDFYHDLSDLMGGYPTSTTPAAGASRIVAYIPFQHIRMPNSMDVQDNQELKIFLNFDAATLATRFGANPSYFELWGLTADAVPEKYELEIYEKNMQPGGAGKLPVEINESNVIGLYYRDDGGIVSNVNLSRDGETAIGDVPLEVLKDTTNMMMNLETSGNPLVFINFVPAGNRSNAISKNITGQIKFTGSGTLQQTIIRLNEVDAATNVQRVNEQLNNRYHSIVGNMHSQPAGSFQNLN